MSKRVSLLIVDYAPTRAGIRLALGDDVRICAEADDAQQAIRIARRMQPDVCLVGRDVAGYGLSAVGGICAAAPNTAVVMLAHAPDVDDMLDAIRAGAVGYVPGSSDADHLRRIVRAAAANEAVVPRAMVLELLLELRSGGTDVDALTSRESQVLGMLRRGQTTAAIADRLQITPVTVRRHVSELVHKLGAADRSELMTRGGWDARRSPGLRVATDETQSIPSLTA